MPSYLTKSLRVYLLDDHDIVRQGLRDLLVVAEDINVVGDSGSARQAAEAIPRLDVDVMVLDVQLQDGTGIDVCREVRAVSPSTAGLLLTSSGDDEALVAAIMAGAAGYVIKLARSSDITAAIRRVGAGKTMLDPVTVERVGRELVAGIDELRPPPTDQQRTLLRHVADGLTDGQIADRLQIPLDEATRDVRGLVQRLTGPTFLQRSRGAATSEGRHRLADG